MGDHEKVRRPIQATHSYKHNNTVSNASFIIIKDQTDVVPYPI